MYPSGRSFSILNLWNKALERILCGRRGKKEERMSRRICHHACPREEDLLGRRMKARPNGRDGNIDWAPEVEEGGRMTRWRKNGTYDLGDHVKMRVGEMRIMLNAKLDQWALAVEDVGVEEDLRIRSAGFTDILLDLIQEGLKWTGHAYMRPSRPKRTTKHVDASQEDGPIITRDGIALQVNKAVINGGLFMQPTDQWTIPNDHLANDVLHRRFSTIQGAKAKLV
ncbi:hypothetical protein BKA93DRAFT_859065 [Sparassis latifolia]